MMKRSNHCSIDHLIVCVWKLKQSTLMSVCAWWWCIIILSIYNHSHNTHSILFIDRFFIFFSFHPKKRIFCLRKENRCCIKTDRFKSIGIKFKWWIRWIWMCVCVCVRMCIVYCCWIKWPDRINAVDDDHDVDIDADVGDYYDYCGLLNRPNGLKIWCAHIIFISHRRMKSHPKLINITQIFKPS